MLKKFAYGILLLSIFTVIFIIAVPGTAYRGIITLERSMSGLEKKSITIDDHTIVYLEGGEGEVILLVHGFNGEKDNWTRFARPLTKKYRVIATDDPGFGESTFRKESSYSIKNQVERFAKFTAALKLKKFHMAGNSMGGAISGNFALRYPERLLSLALINAAGIKNAEKSEFLRASEKGINLLVVKKPADYKSIMNFVFINPPFLPAPIIRYLGEVNLKRTPQNELIFEQIRNDIKSLEMHLHKIKTPTLVLWGDRDRVLHVSGADIFHKNLENSKLVIMKDCGHVPMIERPGEAANHYLNFLKNI